MKTHVELQDNTDKSYATYNNAVKAAEDFLRLHADVIKNMNVNPRFAIMASSAWSKNGKGRFAPIFFNTQNTAIWFAQSGFKVVG